MSARVAWVPVSLLLLATAAADTIVTKDGKTVRGIIDDESTDPIVVRIPVGEVRVKKADVEEMTKDSVTMEDLRQETIEKRLAYLFTEGTVVLDTAADGKPSTDAGSTWIARTEGGRPWCGLKGSLTVTDEGYYTPGARVLSYEQDCLLHEHLVEAHCAVPSEFAARLEKTKGVCLWLRGEGKKLVYLEAGKDRFEREVDLPGDRWMAFAIPFGSFHAARGSGAVDPKNITAVGVGKQSRRDREGEVQIDNVAFYVTPPKGASETGGDPDAPRNDKEKATHDSIRDLCASMVNDLEGKLAALLKQSEPKEEDGGRRPKLPRAGKGEDDDSQKLGAELKKKQQAAQKALSAERAYRHAEQLFWSGRESWIYSGDDGQQLKSEGRKSLEIARSEYLCAKRQYIEAQKLDPSMDFTDRLVSIHANLKYINDKLIGPRMGFVE